MRHHSHALTLSADPGSLDLENNQAQFPSNPRWGILSWIYFHVTRGALTDVRLASGRMTSSTLWMVPCDGWIECFTLTKPRSLMELSTSSVVGRLSSGGASGFDVAEASEAVSQRTHETARICECSVRPGGSRPNSEAGRARILQKCRNGCCAASPAAVNVASDSISEAVQLPSSFAPAQQWHFHGVTALKFAEGKGAGWTERVRRVDSARMCTSHTAQSLGGPTRTNLTNSRNNQV